MKPLVSILIPAFDAEEWIADTIKSAVRQTWPRKEIIVVDDGSTDQTLSIARQFASKEISLSLRPTRVRQRPGTTPFRSARAIISSG